MTKRLNWATSIVAVIQHKLEGMKNQVESGQIDCGPLADWHKIGSTTHFSMAKVSNFAATAHRTTIGNDKESMAHCVVLD